MRLIAWAVIALAGAPLGAQDWRPAGGQPLVVRAIEQRTARDQDTVLARWQARAHGVVRFATVIDHAGSQVERVIRADELQVEVYGEAPSRSKQLITAWRDTVLLPNRVVYHRDHLGIVASDFGAVIRLGDGDEVRDIPHPLALTGTGTYEYALGDTVSIGSGARRTRVVRVDVRPVAGAAGAVGTLYLDVDRAALVRFRFTFTPAAYRDPTVEEIVVTLENALQEGARWLPWRQAIAIRRGSTLLDLPFRTIIRADWTIDDYEFGVTHPPGRFTGPLVGGLRRPGGVATWVHPIDSALAGLPATTDEMAAIRDVATAAVGRSLGGLARTRLAAAGLGALLRVNRVEGVASTLGMARQAGSYTIDARAGIGTAAGEFVGSLALARRIGPLTLGVVAERTVTDVGVTPPGSVVVNTLRTAVDGSDRFDWVGVDRLALTASTTSGTARFGIRAGVERARSLTASFTPLGGASSPNPPLGSPRALAARVAASGGVGAPWTVELDGGAREGAAWGRVAARIRHERRIGSAWLTFAAEGGAGTDSLPSWRTFVLGGRGTLPGVDHRSVGGRRFARIEAALLAPVATRIPLGPVGRVSMPGRVGVFIAAGAAGGDDPTVPWRATGQVEPAAGLRADLFGPTVRLDAGVGLRRGGVAITVDVHPDWWPIL